MKRAIQAWLLLMMGLIGGIVMVGGITRLTGSGLSMVDWHPLAGILPPLTAAGWESVFDAYQQSPEFQKINSSMILSEFKCIFFWEYLHRILGRLIGVAAILPWVYFSVKKHISRPFQWRWLGVIGLIGCQGLMGWYMVKSGLVDNPHVSHFRLAAHLSLAFLIFILILREYLNVQFPGKCQDNGPKNPLIIGTFAMIVMQIIYGAFTAGLNAGHYYNTYPKMGPDWFPNAALMFEGGVLNNIINNPIMIQWVHRWLAMAILIGVVVIWQTCKKTPCPYIKYSGLLLLSTVSFQVILGIITLITVVWLPVAVAHQLGALMLLCSITMLHYFSTHKQ